MICLDCQASPLKICAEHHRTDNLVSAEDIRGMALEEIAMFAGGLHGTLLDAEHMKHFMPCHPCRNALRRLGEALERLRALP